MTTVRQPASDEGVARPGPARAVPRRGWAWLVALLPILVLAACSTSTAATPDPAPAPPDPALAPVVQLASTSGSSSSGPGSLAQLLTAPHPLARPNYRPQFYFRTTDVTGQIQLPEGTEMCMPGDNTAMTVELIHPIAMEEGLRFAIREGGRTVGAGRVTKILK